MTSRPNDQKKTAYRSKYEAVFFREEEKGVGARRANFFYNGTNVSKPPFKEEKKEAQGDEVRLILKKRRSAEPHPRTI